MKATRYQAYIRRRWVPDKKPGLEEDAIKFFKIPDSYIGKEWYFYSLEKNDYVGILIRNKDGTQSKRNLWPILKLPCTKLIQCFECGGLTKENVGNRYSVSVLMQNKYGLSAVNEWPNLFWDYERNSRNKHCQKCRKRFLSRVRMALDCLENRKNMKTIRSVIRDKTKST